MVMARRRLRGSEAGGSPWLVCRESSPSLKHANDTIVGRPADGRLGWGSDHSDVRSACLWQRAPEGLKEERTAVDRLYIAENDAERERLQVFVQQLSDEELSRPMSAGWTVAGVLAHLAFWDGRALALRDKWARGSVPAAAHSEPDASDWINDASKPLCFALPPRAAAHLALQLAEETDQRVAALSDATLAQIVAIGPPFNLSRATHRKEHLDDIERYLR